MPVVSAPVVDAPIVEVPKKTKPAMKPVDFPSSTPAATPAPASAVAPAVAQPPAAEPALRAVTSVELREAWPDILSAVNKVSKSAWMVAFALTVVDFEGDVLTLRFASQKDLDQFKTPDGGSNAVRQAIFDLLGVQVRFKAQVAEPSNPPTTPVAVQTPAAPAAAPATAPIQVHAPAAPEPEPEPDEPEPELPSEVPVAAPAPAEAPAEDTKFQRNEDERYGESLLREMLGAKPINDKNGK
jgi:DNA polymerase-3 subunit gamma/tau